MLRTNEIKSIMRKLRDNSSAEEIKNESLMTEAEDVSTDNDTSEADLLLARLEDIISRFEKALAIVDSEEGGEEAPAEDEVPEEEEAPVEDEEIPADEEEEAEAEESYKPSLEDRLAALERRFTESRRRRACRKFMR